MKEDINQMAFAAKENEAVREQLLRSQEKNILRIASLTAFRFVTKSDDEWSVALCAFSDAIDRYSPDKGNFLSFARLVMKRALIDAHRSKSYHNQEVSISPFVLEGQCRDDASETEKAAYLAVVEQSLCQPDRSLQEEILAVNDELNRYGFRFYDLTEHSPRQGRTKRECAKAIRCLLAQEDLLTSLMQKRRLPVRKLAERSGSSKKLVDRYRKYIVMAAVMLGGDYPHLAEYLRFVREEEEA